MQRIYIKDIEYDDLDYIFVPKDGIKHDLLEYKANTSNKAFRYNGAKYVLNKRYDSQTNRILENILAQNKPIIEQRSYIGGSKAIFETKKETRAYIYEPATRKYEESLDKEKVYKEPLYTRYGMTYFNYPITIRNIIQVKELNINKPYVLIESTTVPKDTQVDIKIILKDKDKNTLFVYETQTRIINKKIEYPFKIENLIKNKNIDPLKISFFLGGITIYNEKMDQDTYLEKEAPVEAGLTIFLAGVGMRGNYQYNFVKLLKEVGITNTIRANYSAFFPNEDEEMDENIDIGVDASAVVFYNQASKDPIALQFANTRGCKKDSEISFFNFKYQSYSGKTIKNEECPNVFTYELAPSTLEFNLKNIGINEDPPKSGQFNFIGYSWGAVISARTALAYANKGIKIDNLVLIGAPINYSLLQAVQNNNNIKNVIIINLDKFGDPIYAGMTDDELLKIVPSLWTQMRNDDGHFYYASEKEEGKKRRKELCENLYKKGLR